MMIIPAAKPGFFYFRLNKNFLIFTTGVFKKRKNGVII